MALVIFFLVERNSSSFSAMRRSISCLTWVSSSWHLSTLFSSCSRALLGRGLAAVDLVSGGTSISDLVHDDSLVLLNLSLDLVELLNLLLHLGKGILVLLLQADNGGLLLDLG